MRTRAIAIVALLAASTAFSWRDDPQVIVDYHTFSRCDVDTGDYIGDVGAEMTMSEPGELSIYVTWEIMNGSQNNVDSDENSNSTLNGTYVGTRALKTGGYGSGFLPNPTFYWYIGIDAFAGEFSLNDELFQNELCPDPANN